MLFRIKEETIDEQFRPIGYCFHKRDAMDVLLCVLFKRQTFLI